jgi:hypothetical protein
MAKKPNTEAPEGQTPAEAPEGLASLMIPQDDTEEAPPGVRVAERRVLWGGTILETYA